MKRSRLVVVMLSVALFIAGSTVGTHAATLHVAHELGTVAVPLEPRRVVVFDFGVLDSLDRLGLDVVGLPKSNVPPYLSKFESPRYTNVGTLQEPDFEAINALKPDLIIISGRTSAHYEQLSRLAPTLYMAVDNDNYVHSLVENVRLLGKVFGVEDAVEEQLVGLEERLQRVRALSADKNALILLVTGGRANAYGLGSRYGFMHDDFGLAPVDPTIKSSTHGQIISWEYVLVHDPDLIFVIDRDAVVSGGSGQTAKQIVENELVKFTTAYTSGNITYLDPTYWYLSGGGLTSFGFMLHDVEAALERALR